MINQRANSHPRREGGIDWKTMELSCMDMDKMQDSFKEIMKYYAGKGWAYRGRDGYRFKEVGMYCMAKTNIPNTNEIQAIS